MRKIKDICSEIIRINNCFNIWMNNNNNKNPNFIWQNKIKLVWKNKIIRKIHNTESRKLMKEIKHFIEVNLFKNSI
jgi:hypothetical protein